MKKTILILFFCFSFLGFGQFTVSDTSNNWIEIGKAYGRIFLSQNTDKTKAKIKYVSVGGSLLGNIDITEHEFTFSTTGDTLDKLHELIKSKLKSKVVEEITLDFPEGKMYLDFDKAFGSYFVQFKFDNESTINDKTNTNTSKRESYGFKIKEIDKLFGIEKQ